MHAYELGIRRSFLTGRLRFWNQCAFGAVEGKKSDYSEDGSYYVLKGFIWTACHCMNSLTTFEFCDLMRYKIPVIPCAQSYPIWIFCGMQLVVYERHHILLICIISLSMFLKRVNDSRIKGTEFLFCLVREFPSESDISH